MSWEVMIWAGAGLATLGLAGVIGCIVAVWRARAAGLPDDALRARLQSAVAWNLAALLTSALGLMLVVFGVILG
ncbi:MAG: hypothetical protein AAFU80_25795 [Pseudomonadota bacterium]